MIEKVGIVMGKSCEQYCYPMLPRVNSLCLVRTMVGECLEMNGEERQQENV